MFGENMQRDRELNNKIKKLDEILSIVGDISELNSNLLSEKRKSLPIRFDFFAGILFFCLCCIWGFTYQLDYNSSNISLIFINFLLPSTFIYFGFMCLNIYFSALAEKLMPLFE